MVKRVDGTQMTYYKSFQCTNVQAADLLREGDGQCGSWAELFIRLRQIQGMNEAQEYVLFEPSAADGFIVKNWTFAGAGTSGVPAFPYLNLPANNLLGADSYSWRYAEVNDAAGIPGQGTANPASMFNNHQVMIGGEYYDPSYGLKHASLQDIDNNAIDGFYVGPGLHPVSESNVHIDLNGDGDTNDTVETSVILFKKNPAGLDLIQTRINY